MVHRTWWKGPHCCMQHLSHVKKHQVLITIWAKAAYISHVWLLVLQLVEGATLLLGAAGCLLVSLNQL